jgi:hypothetical protein
MAKYECKLTGDFNALLRAIDEGILRGSVSAHLEDGSDYASGNIRCAVRVYERYSMMGKGRLSMNVTLVCNGDDLFLSAITAGGSQAMFFKINTFGESAFLDHIIAVVNRFRSKG